MADLLISTHYPAALRDAITIGAMLAALTFCGPAIGQDGNWMEDKLNALKGDAHSGGESVEDWTVKEGGVYVINGEVWALDLITPTALSFSLVDEPPPPVPRGRIGYEVDRDPDRHEYARSTGAMSSHLVGWLLVDNLGTRIGLPGGDGWIDDIGRDDAMTLAQAGFNKTRWEHGIAKLTADIESWGYTADTYDGWLILDIESWNMTLIARRDDVARAGYGYRWVDDTITLERKYLARYSDTAMLDARLAVHPYAVDLSGDGVNDALRITRDDYIAETVRITAKIRATFPKAKTGWYNFPMGLYWVNDVRHAEVFKSWEEGLARIHAAGVLDGLHPSIYDFYSHLFRFPGMTDGQWQRAQETVRQRDFARQGRTVLGAVEMGERIGVPTYLYTWPIFHNSGQCLKAGWFIPDEEWRDHITRLASLRSTAGTEVAGIWLWGALDYYYFRGDSCYQANLRSQIGDLTEEEFSLWWAEHSRSILDRANEIAIEVWGGF